MSRFEALLWGIVVLDVLGFGGLIFWLRQRISDLEKTVKVQKTTLETVENLNRMFREVIAALDPERWAKEVRVHKDLADQKAEALVDAERRRLESQAILQKEKATQTVVRLADYYGEVMKLAFSAMYYIPKDQRDSVIHEAVKSPEILEGIVKFARETPEFNAGLSALRGLAGFDVGGSAPAVYINTAQRGSAVAATAGETKPPDPPKGPFDVPPDPR